MGEIKEGKQPRCMNGAAIILFLNRWIEILRVKGENKDRPYTIPKNGTISIRFPVKDNPELVGKQVRIFMESD